MEGMYSGVWSSIIDAVWITKWERCRSKYVETSPSEVVRAFLFWNPFHTRHILMTAVYRKPLFHIRPDKLNDIQAYFFFKKMVKTEPNHSTLQTMQSLYTNFLTTHWRIAFTINSAHIGNGEDNSWKIIKTNRWRWGKKIVSEQSWQGRISNQSYKRHSAPSVW